MSRGKPVRSAPRYVAEVDEGGLGAVDAVRIGDRKSNLWLDAWRDLRGRWMFWASAVVILFVVFMACFPGVFTQVAPNDGCYATMPSHAPAPNVPQPPAGFAPGEQIANVGPMPGHPFGFTARGCDVFSRVVHGASTSLAVGFLATIIAVSVGLLFGAIAGYFGGWLDSVLMRVGDVFFAIPYILAAVVVMTMLTDFRNVLSMALAIGLFSWPGTARILRSDVLRVKQFDYVMSSEALGQRRWRTMLSHVLPNSITPVIIVTTVGIGGAITAEATLSFLGVGLPQNVMSWGRDIAEAQTDLRTTILPLLFPSIAVSVTTLAFIMLGEVVRDALDPRARAVR